MATGDAERTDVEKPEQPARAAERQHLSEPRSYVPAEIRDVSFPVSVRGYDRGAVDTYVNRVNRVIAELQVSASPRAAVRHALEQAGQQVSGLLDRARQTAEEIAASARQEADEMLGQAKAEAAEIIVNASTQADAAQARAEKALADSRAEAEAIQARAHDQAAQTIAETAADAEAKRRELDQELAQRRAEAEEHLQALSRDTDAVLKGRAKVIDDVQGLAQTLADMAKLAAQFKAGQVEQGTEASAAESQSGADLRTRAPAGESEEPAP